jgi:alpha-L-fucosidase
MKKKNITVACLLAMAAWQFACAQATVSPRSNIALQHGAHRIGKRTDPAMARWRAYGLGQFIHWGLYAIPGGHWNGKYYPGAAEWIRAWDEVPPAAYDSLIGKFNPVKFDAQAWAQSAREMGAKYMIITTKHHDGFCLWPSKYTDYTVANSPWKKDILRPLVTAYEAAGIDVYFYFSVMDWHHPGWRYDIKTPEDSIAFESFKQFTRNQLTELLTQYPSIKGLWFDGTWDKSWVKQAAFADELEQELRSLRPGIIIGSRFRADENGKRHFDTNGNLVGDYEQGWERKLPSRIEDVHGNDWDCVMTVPENQWGYHADWRGHVKTANELIEMMARSVSLGGNFVLNFGPAGDGSIRREELALTKEIGAWMRQNGEAVYHSGYAAWEKQDWGYYTKADNGKVYMIVCNVPVSGLLRVKLPPGVRISRNYRLDKPAVSLKMEEGGKNECLLQLEPGAAFREPVVIVLETAAAAKEGVKYQPAKT